MSSFWDKKNDGPLTSNKSQINDHYNPQVYFQAWLDDRQNIPNPKMIRIVKTSPERFKQSFSSRMFLKND